MRLLVTTLFITAVGVLTLQGCSTAPSEQVSAAKKAQPEPIYIQKDDNKVETIVITTRGYGASPKEYMPEGKRNLMAMRAAKLDAYRALAERIHGVRIWGGTTVGEMVVNQDEFKVLLDAYVVGARIISNMPHKNGNYEAIVEIEVDQDFLYRALAHRLNNLRVPAQFSNLKEHDVDVLGQGDQEVREASKSQANFYYYD